MGTLRERWSEHFLVYEWWLCMAAAATLVAISEVVVGPGRLDSYLATSRFTVFPAMVGAYSALLGLAIAASALVLDRLAEGRLKLVQESRHIDSLSGIFRSAMSCLGAVTLASLIVLVPARSAAVDRCFVYLWALFTLLVIARLARVIWIVGHMMHIVATQEGA